MSTIFHHYAFSYALRCIQGVLNSLSAASKIKDRFEKKKKKKKKNGNCTKSTCITVGRYSLLFIRVALKFRWRFTGILYWQACYQPLVKYSCNVSGEYPSSNLYGNPGDSRIYRRGFVARISARHHSENMLRVPYRFPCTVYEGL